MHIALDATYALDPQPTGVARYSARLIEALACDRAAALTLTLAARAHRFAELLRRYPAPRYRRCLMQEPLNWILPRRVDLFHGLNQRLPRYRFRRQVVTVHDIFPVSSDRYSHAAFNRRFSEFLHDAVSRADRVIAVSRYTRDELVRRMGVDPARIAVVHHGIDRPGATARNPVSPPLILSVGAIQVRKNTLGVVQTLERIPGARLAIAGGDGYGAAEVRDYVRRQGLSSRVDFLGHTSESALDQLYSQAALLLFPSLEEGFGFPVLEALARGVPVVASNTSSIPEIAGDAALLAPPEDQKALANHCLRILGDPAFTADLVSRGLVQASRFTWERAAAETVAVYSGLLS